MNIKFYDGIDLKIRKKGEIVRIDFTTTDFVESKTERWGGYMEMDTLLFNLTGFDDLEIFLEDLHEKIKQERKERK